MNNKKKILMLGALSCVTAIGLTSGFIFSDVFKPVSADKIYEINFSETKNKLNTESESSTDIYTELGSQYSMNQTDLNTQLSSNWASFQKDATFWTEEKEGYEWDNGFGGMKTLQINFENADREFRIYFSRDGKFNENYSRKYASKTSMTIDFEGHPHYFKFEALDPNTITSMTITYSCSFDEDTTWYTSHGVFYEVIAPYKAKYGLYPQTHVGDTELIDILTKKAADLKVNDEEYFWYNDEYYVKDTCNPYEYSTWDEITFSDGAKVKQGDVNFFKCEPIIWNIKENVGDDKRIINCSNILFANMFENYSSSYSSSKLREWLNDAFYTKAFFLYNKDIVKTDLSDVGVTGDNVWAASKDQLSTWYSESSSRTKKVSDFAISNKAFMSVNEDRNGYYWTRTADPSIISNDFVYAVNHIGNFMSVKVSNNYYGVSPALTVKND